MTDLPETSRYHWSVLFIDSKNGDFFGTRQPLKLRKHDTYAPILIVEIGGEKLQKIFLRRDEV